MVPPRPPDRADCVRATTFVPCPGPSTRRSTGSRSTPCWCVTPPPSTPSESPPLPGYASRLGGARGWWRCLDTSLFAKSPCRPQRNFRDGCRLRYRERACPGHQRAVTEVVALQARLRPLAMGARVEYSFGALARDPVPPLSDHVDHYRTTARGRVLSDETSLQGDREDEEELRAIDVVGGSVILCCALAFLLFLVFFTFYQSRLTLPFPPGDDGCHPSADDQQ